MRFALYEEPEFPRLNLTLTEAFFALLGNCGYGPVWNQTPTKVILQFRILEGVYEGQILGTQFVGDDPVTVEAEIADGNADSARAEVMLETLLLGLKGWKCMTMTKFWTQEVIPDRELMQKFKGIRWDI